MENTNQPVYIIGAGAIGKVLAVMLHLNGRKVTLLRGSIDDGAAYTERIRVVMEHKELEADIQVSTLSNFRELDGTIVFTNKSYGNENLSGILTEKAGNSPIVLLQNGLGVERPFVDKGYPAVYRCVLFVTSQVIAKDTVRFKPVAACAVGVIKGNDVQLAAVVEQLDSPDFRFRAEADIQPVIWKKAIVNSVFNSICPLLETDNGIFHRDESVLNIAKRVIHECIAIAHASGVALRAGEAIESLLLISKLSDGQLISTFQDIKNKRPTEIDTLNFEIARIAQSMGKEGTVQETRLLGELTKLKSVLSMG